MLGPRVAYTLILPDLVFRVRHLPLRRFLTTNVHCFFLPTLGLTRTFNLLRPATGLAITRVLGLTGAAGVTGADGAEGAETPWALRAVTVNV